MRRAAVFLTSTLLFALAGCASPTLPPGYKGPVAHVRDSVTSRVGDSADFFFLSEVDGREIDSVTAGDYFGHQFEPNRLSVATDIPAREITLTIVGRTHYRMPIEELLSKVYQVSGQVKFTPAADHYYEIHGVLKDGYSAVWIDDMTAHELVGQKIEVRGDATPGFPER